MFCKTLSIIDGKNVTENKPKTISMNSFLMCIDFLQKNTDRHLKKLIKFNFSQNV